jgi:hypothetical protein
MSPYISHDFNAEKTKQSIERQVNVKPSLKNPMIQQM